MIELLGWVPLFPFLGFLILVLTSERFSKPLISWIGIGSVGISALLVSLIGFEFLNGTLEPYRLMLGSWMEIDDLSVPFGFYLDALSMTMLFVVTGVGFLIHVYSAGFMESDPGYARFFAYMNLFVSAMLMLVLADNLVLLYLGWEGVGLGSYLLIGFWYEDPNNGYAARKAFVMTRIGDTALALGLIFTVYAIAYARYSVLDAPGREPMAPRYLVTDGIGSVAVGWRSGKIRAITPANLATRRHGRSHAGQCPDPCRHDGYGGGLPDCPHPWLIPVGTHGSIRGRGDRGSHFIDGGLLRSCSDGH